jgi:hypothetical protein
MTQGDKAVFQSTETTPRPSAADPAVLGLTGLAVAALVLASGDLGLASAAAKSLMIPWTLMMGATAQLIAGLVDFKRNNLFGATAFTTYSLLLYSVSLTLFITIYTGAKFDITHYAYGLIGFSILVFIDLALFTLVLNIMAKTPKEIVGAFLILAAASSFYGAAGILINTMSGRTVVPPGKALWQPTGAAHR